MGRGGRRPSNARSIQRRWRVVASPITGTGETMVAPTRSTMPESKPWFDLLLEDVIFESWTCNGRGPLGAVAWSSCDAGGDAETSPSAECRRWPSATALPPEALRQGRSRFWALAGESSDEEEEVEAQEVVTAVTPVARSGLTPVCLGDFLDPAWTKVGARKPRGARHRAWAPGGRGLRFDRATDVGVTGRPRRSPVPAVNWVPAEVQRPEGAAASVHVQVGSSVSMRDLEPAAPPASSVSEAIGEEAQPTAMGYEMEVRDRMGYAEGRHHREREREWDRERARAPEWRRDGYRRREEEDRFAVGSSGARDQPKRKMGGTRQGNQMPKAKSVSHSTPHAPLAPTPPPVTLSEAGDAVLVGKKSNIKCFNCSRDGHYQSGCHFPAHCGVCDVDGHTTGMCPKANKKASRQWYGYAVDGVGFHCLEMDDALLTAGSGGGPDHAALVIAVENTMTCDLLTQDLKALVEDNWDWRVRRISDTDFAVVFPTKASLNLCKNLCKNASGIALPVSKISVLFADATVMPQALLALSKIWVHLSGVPEALRNVELLLEGTKMLGRPRVVDEESLANLDGPVMMLFHSHAPDKLPSSVLLFANMQGFRLGVSVEFAKPAAVGPSKPPPPGPDDKGDDEEEEEETEDQSRSGPHWKRSNTKNKDKGECMKPQALRRERGRQ
ncbi:hypothetical protein ACQ4PT_065362 [Festuca glaucescens]